MNCAFIDVDFNNVTESPDVITRALQEAEFPPSKVIHSGHGLHAYWLFDEPVPATPKNTALYEELLRSLAAKFAGDPACCEAARLMRLPGSHNSKNGDEILVKTIADRGEACRYSPEELQDWADSFPASVLHRKSAKANGETINGASIDPFAQYATEAVITPIDVQGRLAEMTFHGAGETSIHQTQVSVSAALLNQGAPLDEIVATLLDATRRAAGATGASWNWKQEERELRKMCATWLKKLEAKGEEIKEEATTSSSSPWRQPKRIPEGLLPVAPSIRHSCRQLLHRGL